MQRAKSLPDKLDKIKIEIELPYSESDPGKLHNIKPWKIIFRREKALFFQRKRKIEKNLNKRGRPKRLRWSPMEEWIGKVQTKHIEPDTKGYEKIPWTTEELQNNEGGEEKIKLEVDPANLMLELSISEDKIKN